MRLNKYISETGICSRREADSWIEQGRVSINGKRAELGTQVNEVTRLRSTGVWWGRRRGKSISR